jgi:hypothetical protein
MRYRPTTNTIIIYSDYGDSNCKLKLYKGSTYIGTFYSSTAAITDTDNPSECGYMYACDFSTTDNGEVEYNYKIYKSNMLVKEETQTHYNCCYPLKPYLSSPIDNSGYIKFTIAYG